jgi:hypothetical protein
VGLQRGPLSLVSATEVLLERKNSGSGLEIREYGHGDPLRSASDTFYPQKLALMSPTSVDRSVGIVRSREFLFNLIFPAAVGLGFNQPLREMSISSIQMMFLGSRARPVRRPDNLTAICEQIVWTMSKP